MCLRFARPQLNGWYLEPIRGAQPGTRVVYLNEIDLNGWIPEAILKIVALQVPLAVADVRKYLTRFGPPAWISLIAYARHCHRYRRCPGSRCGQRPGSRCDGVDNAPCCENGRLRRTRGETVESPAIDHDRSRLDAKIRVDNTVQTATKIGCNKQRYPNGVIATVAPAGTYEPGCPRLLPAWVALMDLPLRDGRGRSGWHVIRHCTHRVVGG